MKRVFLERDRDGYRRGFYEVKRHPSNEVEIVIETLTEQDRVKKNVFNIDGTSIIA